MSKEAFSGAGAMPWKLRLATWEGPVLLLLGGLGLLSMFWLDPYLLKLVAKVFIFWIVVLGMQVLTAHAGVVSLGHGAFMAAGAYIAGALALTGPHSLGVSLAAVILGTGVLGAIIGMAVLRTQGLYQLMATLAVGQMMYYGFQGLRSLGGDDGFPVEQRPHVWAEWSLDSDRALGVVVVLLALLVAVAVRRFRRSEMGALMQAGRDDAVRLASLGESPYRMQWVAFVVSAVLAGVGGAFLAHLTRYASPQMGHWLVSGELIVLVLLGGAATRIGPLLACAALVLIQAMLAQYTDHWPLALGLLVLMRVLWPQRGKGAR